jgi:hypothetical protein
MASAVMGHPLSCWAGVGATGVEFDIVVNFSDGTGALTATKMNNGTHGAAWGSWTVEDTIDHTAIEDHAVTLPFKLLVDGSLYDGSEGQGITFDLTGAPTTPDVVSYGLTESVTDCVAVLLVRYNTTAGADDYYNDTIAINGGGSNFTVPQYRHLAGGTQHFTAHSSGDLGRNITYSPESWVIVWVRHDATNLIGEMFVQDLDTLVVLGASKVEHSPAPDPVSSIRLQDYLRNVNQGEGNIQVKLVAFREDMTFPPRSITVPASTDVEAEQTDDAEVTLTWSNGCQIFTIERNKNSAGWTTLESAYNTNGVLEYVDTDVVNTDQVQYRVTALIGSQSSSAVTSNTVTVAQVDWDDAIAGASTTSNETNGDASARQVVSCTKTGSCTKLRAYIRDWQGLPGEIKMALYDSSFNLLGEGSVTNVSPASGTHQEVSLETPVAVTASTTYYVGYAVPSSPRLRVGYHSSSGNARLDFGTNYAAFPPDPISGADNVTWTFGVGMGVI